MFMHAKSFQLCPSLWDPMDCGPPGSCPWDPPGKNTGVGCHVQLQRIFLTQESKFVSCDSCWATGEALEKYSTVIANYNHQSILYILEPYMLYNWIIKPFNHLHSFHPSPSTWCIYWWLRNLLSRHKDTRKRTNIRITRREEGWGELGDWD